MTVLELARQVLIQCNLDTDDLSEYSSQIVTYLNDGYERLYKKWYDKHLPDAEYLKTDTDTPNLPIRMHLPLPDWATWLMYRNGNVAKQNRGAAFKIAFEEFLSSVPAGGGVTSAEDLKARAQSMQFINLYRS